MQDGNVDLGLSAYYRDGDLEGAPQMSSPTDVVVDADGFFYAVDEGNQRVLRYSDTDRAFVQIVNVENNASGLPLQRPVAVAADKDLVYVADRDAGEVIRYRRRP
jgi:DNA-binding beta-propeller fold protein YncE